MFENATFSQICLCAEVRLSFQQNRQCFKAGRPEPRDILEPWKPQVWSKSTVGLVATSASKIFKNGVIDYHEDQFEMIEKLEKKKRYR